MTEAETAAGYADAVAYADPQDTGTVLYWLAAEVRALRIAMTERPEPLVLPPLPPAEADRRRMAMREIEDDLAYGTTD